MSPGRMSAPPNNATRILSDIVSEKAGATSLLLPLVYDELHRLAEGYMRRERGDHTLQPTALVHEAYVRLIDADV